MIGKSKRISTVVGGLVAILTGLSPDALGAAAPPDSIRVKSWLRRCDSLLSISPPQAQVLADSARRLAHTARLPRLEVMALLARATTAHMRADYPTAAAFSQQAYTMARQHGSPSVNEWKALNLMVSVDFYREQFPEAIRYARQQLAVAEALGQDDLLTRSVDNLGSALSENKEFKEAAVYLKKSRETARRQGNKQFESKALVNLAVNEFYQDRLVQAVAWANEAMMAARQQADSTSVVNAVNVRAVFRSSLGEHPGAVADAEYALRLTRNLGLLDQEMLVRTKLSSIYEKAGRLADALAAERTLRSLNDSIASVEVGRKMAELNTRFGVEQQQARIVKLTQEQRIATLSADRAQARFRLLGTVAAALAVLLLVGGWLLRQVRRSRAQLAVSAAELRAANVVKDQLNATKDQLMRIIGHDLRAPLATFEQFAPVLAELADAPDPAEQHRLAGALADQARAVSELVDNLLNWSRAQTGQVQALPQWVRLAVVAQSMQRVFAPVAAVKGVRLEVECAAEVPDSLLLDPNLLGAVLRNLLGNAIKFTPPGGTVRLGIEPGTGPGRPAAAVLTVADTGRGMKPGQLAAALDGNPVSSTAGTNGEPGTGLGLAVCRHFVGLLDAGWRGESTAGTGTRWTLTLPAAPLAPGPGL